MLNICFENCSDDLRLQMYDLKTNRFLLFHIESYKPSLVNSILWCSSLGVLICVMYIRLLSRVLQRTVWSEKNLKKTRVVGMENIFQIQVSRLVVVYVLPSVLSHQNVQFGSRRMNLFENKRFNTCHIYTLHLTR